MAKKKVKKRKKHKTNYSSIYLSVFVVISFVLFIYVFTNYIQRLYVEYPNMVENKVMSKVSVLDIKLKEWNALLKGSAITNNKNIYVTPTRIYYYVPSNNELYNIISELINYNITINNESYRLNISNLVAIYISNDFINKNANIFLYHNLDKYKVVLFGTVTFSGEKNITVNVNILTGVVFSTINSNKLYYVVPTNNKLVAISDYVKLPVNIRATINVDGTLVDPITGYKIDLHDVII